MIECPDLLRLRYDFISINPTKRYFEDPREVFDQPVFVTEKVDGSQMAVGWKNDTPYLQGKNSHIDMSDKRKAYDGAWSWAWQNVEKIQQTRGFLVIGEWLKIQHSLPYDNLPDWFLVFDIWDNKQKKFLNFKDVQRKCTLWGFYTVPLLFEGKLKYADLPEFFHQKKSNFLSSTKLIETKFSPEEIEEIRHPHFKGRVLDRFSDGLVYMEGVVVKAGNAPKFTEEKKSIWWTNCAKCVSAEFIEDLSDDAHWTSTRARENKLGSWAGF